MGRRIDVQRWPRGEITIKRGFIDDISGRLKAERIHALGKPLLLVHALREAVVTRSAS